jgi:hypothetical protein
MAQPVFYQTLNMLGIDPTIYYANVATAGGSVTPEYPAPPFVPGTLAFGSDGTQFIFVQASTSVSLTDFVLITAGTSPNPFLANSITTANAGVAAAASAANMAVASAGLVLKQSVSYIPANAMFWACTKGDFIPATTSANFGGLVSGAQVVLYTTTSPGQMSTTASIISSSSIASVAFAGFNVVSSVSISIAASVVPPAGTLTNGFTVGPVVSLNNPRTVVIQGIAATGNISAQVYW